MDDCPITGEERRSIERMMSRCLIVFLFGYFRRTLHIPKLGGLYKYLGFYLEGVLQSWIIVQLVSLKKFGSDSQMGYDDYSNGKELF